MSETAEAAKKKKFNFKGLFHNLRIYRFILPYKWQFIIGMICLVISTGVVSIIPGGFGKLIDAASPAKETVENISQTLKSSATSDGKLSHIKALVDTYASGIKPEKLKDIGILLGAVLLIQAFLSFIR